MRSWAALSMILVTVAILGAAVSAALIVPTEIQQPGTQAREVGNLETPDKCDNCHGGYNQAVEPSFNWRGSMMANATRDPLFWATLAVAEQDFPGAGDLCIRCHSLGGWYAGRSLPTDGSGLAAGDADGVECHGCHRMTNPNEAEHAGVMFPPFVANDGGSPATGYYGSGMLSLWGGNEKLGPYVDAVAKHQVLSSAFHRSVDFCGSCHDVSNPAVGDLAHNQGRQPTADPVVASGVLGSPVEQKAAFNNFPYQYGVVERTFSEFKAGLLSQTRVSAYPGLPNDLKAGAIKAAFESAGGDYADGTPRYFSCQTCHLRATRGQGANKAGTPLRTDLPLHDMTGGNYWVPEAILYQNAQGTLRLGAGLTSVQIDALRAGQSRARQQLEWAASLDVAGNTVRITNLTGHKLLSGYPEGRRMWLNVRWYDATDSLLREDGAYGTLEVTIDGVPTQVRTILDPGDPNAKIYEAHYAMTQEWATQLLALGYSPALPLGFDRLTGAVSATLGDLASQLPGTYRETFHFVLNNHVAKDIRIPPYGMSYDAARRRNALPVPADQYGNPGAGGVYQHWDVVALNPPAGAVYATIRLLYQPTSWEYIQFLHSANNRTNPFLANEGEYLLQAWLNTGMAEPHIIASATWGSPPAPTCQAPGTPQSLTAVGGRRSVTLTWAASSPAPTGGYRIHYVQAGKLQFRAGVAPETLSFKDAGLSRATQYGYVVTAWTDCNENQAYDAGADTESPASNEATATTQ